MRTGAIRNARSFQVISGETNPIQSLSTSSLYANGSLLMRFCSCGRLVGNWFLFLADLSILPCDWILFRAPQSFSGSNLTENELVGGACMGTPRARGFPLNVTLGHQRSKC